MLDEFSVDFERVDHARADDGIVEITRANLFEVSIVLNAAVPGSESPRTLAMLGATRSGVSRGRSNLNETVPARG